MRIAPLVVGTLACLGLSSCGDLCGNTVLTTIPSPDARYVAIVFTRDCGATTDFSTQLSVLSASRGSPAVRASDSGNALIIDANHGAAPAGQGGGPELRAVWETPTRLKVQYHHAARVFRSVGQLGEVSVHYDATLPSGG